MDTNGVARQVKTRSIKFKFILCTILIFVIVGVIVSSISAYAIYSSTFTSLEKSMSEAARLAAEGIQNKLDVFDSILTEIASNELITNTSASEEAKTGFLAEKTQMYSEYGSVFFFADTNARVYGTTLNVSDRDFFQASIKGEHFLSPPQVDGETGKLHFAYSVPAYDSASQQIGVLYMTFDYQVLYEMIEQMRVGETGGAYVINPAGDTVLYEDYQLVVDKYNTHNEAKSDPSLKPLADLEDKAANGETGFGFYSYGGANKFLAYAPIPETHGWAVLLTAARGEFMSGLATGIFLCITGFTICALIGIFIIVGLTGKIVRPINQCVQRIQKLAAGDLTSEMPAIRTNDETRTLADSTVKIVNTVRFIVEDLGIALEQMGTGDFTVDSRNLDMYTGDFHALVGSMEQIKLTLSNALSQINQASDQVAAGSSQVSSAAQALSQGATEQASSIDTLAATIGEIAAQVKDTASNAENARSNTAEAGVAVESCNKQMQEMISAMEEINNKSSEIGKIIKTIEDIAFQTNILALNAAVEAARAGAAGKGFAVVADEVRNLASKSAEASKNTSTLIEGTTDAVERGTQIVNTTAASLAHVVESAQTTAEIVDKIAVAADSQASSIEQVTVGIDQISAVVQTNSATAEESAASSEELSSQAQVLKTLVGRFKLITTASNTNTQLASGFTTQQEQDLLHS